MELFSPLDQIERASISLRTCHSFLLNFLHEYRDRFISTNSIAEDLIKDVDSASEQADKLLLLHRRRKRFLDQQLQMEQQFVGLDESRIRLLAEALTSGNALYQSLPEFHNPSLLSALQGIAARVENYDKEVEVLMISLNASLRGLRRASFSLYSQGSTRESKEFLSLVPEDLRF